MNQNTPATEDGGKLFTLATKTRPPHLWGPEKMVCAPLIQKEKACLHCSLVRITVLQGNPHREYRWGNGPQFERDIEPDCMPSVEHQQQPEAAQ